jgi:nucleotidyltransferase substrate binding protein (TIGR01987 family)
MSRINQRLVNFKNALLLLQKSINSYNSDKNNEVFHLAVIQSFEIVFELSWKLMKDYLFLQGIELYTPREVIKESFSINFLEDGQLWIDMLADRNASSHEYSNEKIFIILEKISNIYFSEFKKLEKLVEAKIL